MAACGTRRRRVGAVCPACCTGRGTRARICRTLEAELASVGSGGGGGGSAQFKKYDRAVGIQRDQLSTARSRARRAGCGFTFLNVGPAMCAPLNAQIERMERNLDALQRKRTALSGGGGDEGATAPASSRRSTPIIAAATTLSWPTGELQRRDDGDGRSFFDRLFGGGVREGLPEEEERGGWSHCNRAMALEERSPRPPWPASSAPTARSRSSDRSASFPRCACAPATVTISRCRPIPHRPISIAT